MQNKYIITACNISIILPGPLGGANGSTFLGHWNLLHEQEIGISSWVFTHCGKIFGQNSQTVREVVTSGTQLYASVSPPAFVQGAPLKK